MFETRKAWKKLYTALPQDDVGQVKEALGRLDLDKSWRWKYRKLCFAAARAGASKSLEAILEAGGGFNFNDRYGGAQELLTAAIASPNPVPLMSVIYATNRVKKEIPEHLFINKDAPADVIQGCLGRNPSLFENFIKQVGLHSTEKLKIILTFTSAAPRPKSVLNEALAKVATTGDTDKARLLLERGADPNHAAGQPLYNAAGIRNRDMAGLLLPHVTAANRADVMTRLRQEKEPPEDIIAIIEAAPQPVAAKATAAAATDVTVPPQQEESRFRRLNDDTLEETQPLSNGWTRTRLFDLRLGQEEIFLTHAKNGSVSPVTVASLGEDAIGNLRKIFNDLAGSEPPVAGTPMRSAGLVPSILR